MKVCDQLNFNLWQLRSQCLARFFFLSFVIDQTYVDCYKERTDSFSVIGQSTIVVFFVLQNGFCLLWIFYKPLPYAMFVLYCLEHTGGISTSCSVRQKTNSSKSNLSSKEHLYGKCSQWVQYKDQDWTLCRHLQYIILFSHIYIFI